jgi:hypothetical protein
MISELKKLRHTCGGYILSGSGSGKVIKVTSVMVTSIGSGLGGIEMSKSENSEMDRA